MDRRQLAQQLEVEPRFLGQGYGIANDEGRDASKIFRQLGLSPLDTTYSAKAAAGFFAYWQRASQPILFWSTKSSAPLPSVSLDALAKAPRRLRRWIQAAEQALGSELPSDYRRLPTNR
jgi:hypothetical protein